MELGVAATLFLAFCIVCLFSLAYNLKSRSLHLPPGPFPLPVLGNCLHLVRKNLIQAFTEASEKYGPVCTLHLASNTVVIFSGLDALKEALLNEGDAFNGRGPFPIYQILLKDYGVGLSSGERWKQLRQFSVTTLRHLGMGKKSFEKQIQEEAQYLLEEFRKTKEVPFDPSSSFSWAITNVMCFVLFGNRFDYKDQTFLNLVKAINKSFSLLNSKRGQVLNSIPLIMKYYPRAFPEFLRNLKQLKYFVSEQIRMHQKTLDLHCPRDFIDSFLIKMEQEAANPLTEFHLDSLVSSLIGVVLAGTETLTSTMRYSFLIFQKYPEIVEKIHAELDQVIGRDRRPCMEDRSKIPYTDAVIHEIQRFADIAPLGLPRAVIKDTTFRGYTIPKGTTAFFLLTTVLKDPKLFENPETFNPSHFLDEKGSFRKSEAFIPFSLGKRNCLGEGLARMELFLFITTILQNFTLKPTRDPKDIDLAPEISGLNHFPSYFQVSVHPR